MTSNRSDWETQGRDEIRTCAIMKRQRLIGRARDNRVMETGAATGTRVRKTTVCRQAAGDRAAKPPSVVPRFSANEIWFAATVFWPLRQLSITRDMAVAMVKGNQPPL
jgi:hypothetical protein